MTTGTNRSHDLQATHKNSPPTDPDVLLDVRNLETTFFSKSGGFKAVNNINYQIKRGKTLGIVGESGCGKSVTSFSLMRLIEEPGRITNGQVWLNGRDVLQLPEHQMENVRGKEMAMIFQEPMTALNPVLTIGHQMDEQILRHQKCSPQEARLRSIEMLSLVGIPSPEQRYSSYPHQLSGGMRQRAMIAMALTCEPKLLIADEPTTALDVTIQAQILELIQTLQEKFKMTVQFITHDLGVISEISDDVMVMYAGQTCEKTDAAQIFSNPRHPYTAALIESRPKFGERVARLRTIEGSAPSPKSMPIGCPFVARCTRAQSDCVANKPPLLELSPGHQVACFNPV